MVILDATPAPTAASPKINADTMLIALPMAFGNLIPASFINWKASIIIITSTKVGKGTPALDTASLNINNVGIIEKWWVITATYNPGRNEAIKKAIHLNTLLKLVKYLFSNLLTRMYMPIQHDRIQINKVYTNKIQYQNLNSKDMIFTSLINISLQNNIIGYMRFCIPYESTKDIINDFNTRGANSSDIKEEESERHIEGYEIYPYIKNVDLNVTAQLGTAKVSINDLLNLELGDVIILDQKINEDITVNIGDAKAYKAKPGILGSKNGVEITDIIR